MAEQQRLLFGHAAGPIFTHCNNSVEIRAYGDIFDYDPTETDLAPQRLVVETLTRPPATAAWCVSWQRLANDAWPESRFRVDPFMSTPMHHERFVTIPATRCDGVILGRCADAVAMTSRDCPILVLYRHDGGPVAVLHCSRSSLTGADRGEPGRSVIHEAFKLLGPGFARTGPVSAVLTMGIAAEHFRNERYPAVIEGLRHRYPHTGVVGGSAEEPTIDLHALVCAQLGEHGVPLPSIVHDGLDTYTDGRLASVRAKRGGHNLTIVLRKR